MISEYEKVRGEFRSWYENEIGQFIPRGEIG